MITLRNTRVSGFDRDSNDISWEVEPTTLDIQEFEFSVERSESEAGPFVAIIERLIDRYFVRDNDLPTTSHIRVLFYRIKVRHPLSGREEYSEIVSRRGSLDLLGQEVARLESVAFREYMGCLAWLFPVRTFGQRCPQCWDSVMRKSLMARCPTCYGTGFSGGYHYPIQFYAQLDESPEGSQRSMHQNSEQKVQRFRCPTSPAVKEDDLFIDSRNRRMRVMQVHGTTRLNVRLRQEVDAVLLPAGSIEDSIPLRVDSASLELAAYRNFTNPQNPEAAGSMGGDDLNSLLSRYGFST